MVSTFGPGTGVEKFQAEIKRKSAQLDQVENQLQLLKNEVGGLKTNNTELQQAVRRKDTQVNELSAQLSKTQVLLKQREAAASNLQQQLESLRSRPGSASVGVVTPKGPLSRQGSDEEALAAEVSEKSTRIRKLEAELADARRQVTPRQQRASEDSGMAVAGGAGGGMSGPEANRLRELRAECETWKDRSESLMTQVKDLQRKQQAIEIERGQLADSAATLSEKCVGLEDQVKAAQDALSSLRAVSDQGQGNFKAELLRKESDLGRMQAQQANLEDLVDELKATIDKLSQEKEHMQTHQQQLQAQLAKRCEEAKQQNLEIAQLRAMLDDKAAALEAAEAGLRDASSSKFNSDAYTQDLVAKAAAANKERSQLESELRQKCDELQAATETLEVLQAQVKSGRERGEAAGLSADSLKLQLAAVHKEAEARERSLADAVAALDSRQMELDELSIKAAHNDENRGALLAKLQSLERQLEEAKGELAAQSVSAAEMATALELSQEEAEGKSKEALLAVSQVQASQVAIDRTKARSEQEAADLQAVVAGQEGEIAALKEQLEVVHAQARDSEHKVAQMQALMRQVEDLRQKADEGEGALQLASAHTASMEAELSSTMEVLTERQLVLNSAHAAVAEKDRKIGTLEMGLQEQVAAVAAAERQLKEREERLMEYESGKAGVAVGVADLKHQLRTYEMSSQDLERELTAARTEGAALTASVARLEAELRTSQQRELGLSGDLEEAPLLADAELKLELEAAGQTLAAEQAAHSATKALLKQQEASMHKELAAMEVAAAGTAAAAATASAAASPSRLSPREAAAMRQQVLELEGELTSLQLADAERQIAEAQQEHGAPLVVPVAAEQVVQHPPAAVTPHLQAEEVERQEEVPEQHAPAPAPEAEQDDNGQEVVDEAEAATAGAALEQQQAESIAPEQSEPANDAAIAAAADDELEAEEAPAAKVAAVELAEEEDEEMQPEAAAQGSAAVQAVEGDEAEEEAEEEQGEQTAAGAAGLPPSTSGRKKRSKKKKNKAPAVA